MSFNVKQRRVFKSLKCYQTKPLFTRGRPIKRVSGPALPDFRRGSFVISQHFLPILGNFDLQGTPYLPS